MNSFFWSSFSLSFSLYVCFDSLSSYHPFPLLGTQVHRDIKPENILLSPVVHPGPTGSLTSGITYTAKLVDFGAARELPMEGDGYTVGKLPGLSKADTGSRREALTHYVGSRW